MDHAGGPYPGQPGDILRAESGPAERQDVLARRARVHERLPLPPQDRPFPANACRPVGPLAIPAAAASARARPRSPQVALAGPCSRVSVAFLATSACLCFGMLRGCLAASPREGAIQPAAADAQALRGQVPGEVLAEQLLGLLG